MKFIAILLVAFVAIAKATDAGSAWEKFKVDYGKVYQNGREHAKRFNIFKNNLALINEHNKLFESGKSSFSMGINKYTDMTHEEFFARFNGLVAEEEKKDPANEYVAEVNDLPKSVDWRTKGYVTPVKDQGDFCGSCWAFSSTGALEGAHFKKTGKLVSLSEQNLVDCDKEASGCRGGWPFTAFEYVIKNHGINTEQSYPYEALNFTCRFKKDNVGATISSFKNIKPGDEQDLTAAIANEGPVSVCIDASHINFQHYKEGVFYEPYCSSAPEDLTHAVLAVGYGTDDKGEDIYILKNSWGESWGKKGYFTLPRNKENYCGIATAATIPIA